jgi:alpha-tubulin suppressor-like RCC1 family protein
MKLSLKTYRLLPVILLAFVLTACPNDNDTTPDNCGDGVVDVGEDCDGIVLATVDCKDFGYYEGTLGCDDSCKFITGLCEGVCGDDVIDSSHGEECDGAVIGSAQCSAGGSVVCGEDCFLDYSGCFEWCGDGVIQSNDGEECDGEDLNSAQCSDLGYYSGEMACTDNCELDSTQCSGMCGDNEIQISEDCDGDDLNDESCRGFGFWYGDLTCQNTCNFEYSDCHSFTSVSAGKDHVCALDEFGASWCWGRNTSNGCLGTGDYADSPIPIQTIMDGKSFSSISSGSVYTCSIDTQGMAWCWGENGDLILGIGSSSDKAEPVPVNMPENEIFNQISAGSNHVCALNGSGSCWCWGQGFQGQLGTNSNFNYSIPTSVVNTTVSSFDVISAGSLFTCGIESGTGDAYCWGDNGSGQLGDASTTDRLIPTLVSSGVGISYIDISAGENHTCAVDLSGEAWCWGENDKGQLGDDDPNGSRTPKKVPLEPQVVLVSISASSEHTCGLDSTGSIWCWGNNLYYQLGTDALTESLLPVRVLNSGYSMVESGEFFNCATYSYGQIRCWGKNSSGQLGNNDTSHSATPINVYVP